MISVTGKVGRIAFSTPLRQGVPLPLHLAIQCLFIVHGLGAPHLSTARKEELIKESKDSGTVRVIVAHRSAG